MKSRLLVILITIVTGTALAPSVHAISAFRKEFKSKYVDNGSDDLKAAFKKSSCNTCHVKGKKKKVENLNAYGAELAKLVEGDGNKRYKESKTEKEEVLKEFKKALEEVAKKKNDDDETYGDRISAGKLPVE